MHVLTKLDVDLITRCRERDEFIWIDLVEPTDAELGDVGEALGWNPLLTEDLQHGGQRPKIEDFADHTLVVCYAAAYRGSGQEIVLFEHGVVVHGDYVVTVRPGSIDAFAPLRESLAVDASGLSEASIVHRIVDVLVDTTTAASDVLAAEIDRMEQAIDDDTSTDTRTALRSLRRDLVLLRSTAVAQRDALGSLAAAVETIPGFEVGMRSHFRDITDHARRVVDQLDMARDLLDAAFEAQHAMLIARQGAVMQRLTVLSSIFLPLTFVTGFFGQNFGWMVDHIASRQAFLLCGVGASAATGLLFLLLFRRLRWW